MRKWLLTLLLTMLTASVTASEINLERIDLGLIGNENEIGVFAGVPVSANNGAGIDVRWLDATSNAEEGYSISGYVIWEAVPRFQLPVAGLFPQFDPNAIPTSVEVALDLGGRIGIVDRDQHRRAV
jgi:hypothetical protein